MSTAEKIDYCSADYQRAVGDFVRREVIYCVSCLISNLAKWPEDEHYEDILSICVSDDWESAAYDEGWRKWRDGLFHNVNDGIANSHGADDWQDLCSEYDIEPYQREAYEHWIVSDWLADRLEAKGEMVARDIHGLTVWGRCTTGQAILLDRVICEIYNELHN